MKLYFVRHGDKEREDYYNQLLRHQDPPLTEEGLSKSRRLVDYFKDKHVDKIMTSEYLRAYQTSRYVAEDKGLRVTKDSRLNEIDNGAIESMSDEEIKGKYPEFWDDFFSFTKDVRFPEGETGEEVKARQKDLLDGLLENDEDVLLITHEGYIRLLVCHLTGLPVYKRILFNIDMCGITEIEYDKELKMWRVLRVNDTLVVPGT